MHLGNSNELFLFKDKQKHLFWHRFVRQQPFSEPGYMEKK